MMKRLDVRLVKLMAAIYGLVCLVSFFQASYFIVSDGTHKTEAFSWIDTFFYFALLDWMVVVPVMTVVAVITKELFRREASPKYIIIFHLLIALVVGWFILFCQGLIQLVSGRIDMTAFQSVISLDTTIQYLNSTFLIYLVLLGVIYIYYYIERIKEVEQQKSLLSKQLSDRNIKALQAQVQPHFLFNTLNSISTLIELDAKQAQNTLSDLCGLLRDIINLKERNIIRLSEELKIVTQYVDIIKVRFSDHLKIKYRIDENCMEAMLPSMIIQPLVENAIKHGFSRSKVHVEVLISVKKQDKSLLLQVSNSGQPLADTLPDLLCKGVGLKNINDRLQTIYKDNFNFDMYNDPATTHVITEISVPFKTSVLQHLR